MITEPHPGQSLLRQPWHAEPFAIWGNTSLLGQAKQPSKQQAPPLRRASEVRLRTMRPRLSQPQSNRLAAKRSQSNGNASKVSKIGKV
ncbi:hypothetical protein [Neorhodopirellula lusitana]|uniref:hypothetical protein n=1 Tax=Neorhodopirellula lusitana TaxID=445327 RepID=UPI00384DEA74